MKKLTSIVLALVMALSLCTTAWAAENVAKIGTNEYATLADAVAAVTDDTATTITLLKDCTGAGIVVESGRNITFDFAGHTYTVNEAPLAGSPGTQSQCFQLLQGSTITMKNGAIVANLASIGMIIQNYCDLTLVNMTLNAKQGENNVSYALSNNCGNVEINNSSITAKDGEVAFDSYGGFGNYDDVNVKVTGNSQINGKIEVTRPSSSTNDNKNELSFESGTHNGDFSVTPSDKTTVAVTGGQFSANVTEFVPAGTAVAKDESDNHYVGGDTIADAANSGKEMTMVQGGPVDGLEPGAVIIVPKDVTGTTLNGNAAEWGYYTIADPNANTYLDEPIRRQNTTTVEDTTPAAKADDTTKTDTVTSAKTFDAGVVMYAVMGVMSLTGSAWIVGKKKEF